jgi:hypothetical protein
MLGRAARSQGALLNGANRPDKERTVVDGIAFLYTSV